MIFILNCWYRNKNLIYLKINAIFIYVTNGISFILQYFLLPLLKLAISIV